MSVLTKAARDAPHTRERRRAILSQMPLTARLAPEHAARILAASALATCPGGTRLFAQGDAPLEIFIVVSGIVQIRAPVGGITDAAAEPSMHLRLRGPGDIVADRELACLAAGLIGRLPRRQAAIVLGEPAEILAIDQAVLAQTAHEDAHLRAVLAGEVTGLIDTLERLADELAGLKNFGKVRLARLLLEFFDRMGQMRGEFVQIPHLFSHADMAAALGLTRRSVFDDILALEDFGAIDHDRAGRLVLRDRLRLLRIASLEPSEDRDIGARAWRVDIEAALAGNDSLRAFELAREALQYHPRDPELRYLAVLSALRTGVLEDAEKLIATYKFSSADADERVAALAARVMKERAFAAGDRETMVAYAQHAADIYAAAHRRTGGEYTALNAASMYCAGARAEDGLPLARALTAAPLAHGAGYWAHATRAEAFWLLGQSMAAADMLRRAMDCTDADDGKIATTRLQTLRLAAACGRDASPLLSVFPARRLLVCTAPPSKERLGALQSSPWAAAFVAVTDLEALGDTDWLDQFAAIDFVLAAPAEILLRRAPARALRVLSRGVCHLADTAGGDASFTQRENAWRRAAGLGHLAAAERGYELRLLTALGDIADDLPHWAAPDALAEGQAAVLWVQAEDRAAQLAQSVAGAERVVSANAATLRFSAISDALAAANALRDQAHGAGLAVRLCLDVENLSNTPLEAALLTRLQPLIRPGEIFASEAAAAELSLLRRTDMRLIAVGLVRSQRRLNRMPAWVIKAEAAWR